MLDSANRIAWYLVGFDEDGFYRDIRTVDAVCMNLVRIGEAAGDLSEQVTAAAPHLPWQRMRDMRNRLAHNYAGVQLGIVWRTATLRVPELAAFLRGHLGLEP